MKDESSSGMDPGARRNIWGLIAAASKDHTLVLMTHSMEEAAALCGNVSIYYDTWTDPMCWWSITPQK